MRRDWVVSVETLLEKPIRIRGYAIHAGTTRNLNRYLEDELIRAASTLKGVPVYLEHISASNAVGRVVDAWYDPDERAIVFEAEIHDEEVAGKIRRGLIKHVSIGADYEILDLQDGVRIPRDIAFRELSLVAVPGDREANIVMVMEKLVEVSSREEGNGCNGSGSGEERAVRYQRYPLAPEELDWDADAAEQRIRRWASSDGSGDRDKIDWGKYRMAFAWYDENAPDNLGSYKLPHHDVIDGRLHTVWRGVAAAMAALMGARGGVDIPGEDRRQVYNHLRAHYEDFGREPPSFRESKGETSESGDMKLRSIGAESMSPESMSLQPQPAGEPPQSAGGAVGGVAEGMSESIQPKGLVVDEGEGSRARLVESVKRSLKEQWEKPISLPSTPTARIATFVIRSDAVEGRPGDVVNIPYVRDFDLDVLSDVGGSLTPKTGLYGTVQTVLKEAAATANIPYADIEKLTEDILARLEERFVDGALRAIDKHILDTLIADANVPELDKSGAAVNFDADWVVEALSLMMTQGKSVEPGDCILVINSKMYEALIKDIAATQPLAYARPDIIQKGILTEFLGVKILVSNYLPEYDAATHKRSAYLIHRDAIVFAPKRELLMETFRDTVARVVKLTGSITFGIAVIDDKAVVEIKTPVA